METHSSPTVSVIIPCHNQAQYLSYAVHSVVAQSFEDWECIVIDDGSFDHTRDIIIQLSKAYPRVRGICQEQAGSSAARNRGLREACGRYIQFLDADDFIAPDKLKKQVAILSADSMLSVSLCDYYYTDEDGNIYQHHPCYRSPMLDASHPLQDIALRWENELSVPIHCFLFDARVFKDYGIEFDTNLKNNEDWDCWMQIFALNPTVYFLNDRFAYYRLHSGSKTQDRVEMRRGFLKAIGKQRILLKDAPDIQAILAKKIRLTKQLYRPYIPPWSTWSAIKSNIKALINITKHSCQSARRRLNRTPSH